MLANLPLPCEACGKPYLRSGGLYLCKSCISEYMDDLKCEHCGVMFKGIKGGEKKCCDNCIRKRYIGSSKLLIKCLLVSSILLGIDFLVMMILFFGGNKLTYYLTNYLSTFALFFLLMTLWLTSCFYSAFIKKKKEKAYEEVDRQNRMLSEMVSKKHDEIAGNTKLDIKDFLNAVENVKYDLPGICPYCDKKSSWVLIGEDKTQSIDSAVTLMGATTVFTKENVKRHFKCKHCGVEITK